MNRQRLAKRWHGRALAVALTALGIVPLLWTTAALAQGSAAVRPPKVKIERHTLRNGLKMLMVEDHSAPVINLQVWYHVGSKDEQPGRTGFAHLFEHMMFKGSAHVEPEQHGRIIEAAGGIVNAYTNTDVTVYWETFPSNSLERMVWLEADRMGSLNVDEANLKSEREVVKEERRLRYENPPYGLVIEDLYAAAFTVHPYKHTTIGSMDDLNKATLADVREFHDTFYRPDNATMVIVGDLSTKQAIAWAEKYFGGIPKPSRAIPRINVKEPAQTAERRFTKWYDSKSPLPAVIAGYRTPAQYDPDYYALNLASLILSGGESSRLYRKLVYEDQVAVQSAGFGNFTEDPNLFFAFAVMNPGKNPAEGEKSIDAILQQMKTTPVDAKELEKAKNQILSGQVLGRSTVQQKADALGRAAVIGGDPELVNKEVDLCWAVTPADIQRVVSKYFDKNQRTVLVIEPPAAQKKSEGGNGK